MKSRLLLNILLASLVASLTVFLILSSQETPSSQSGLLSGTDPELISSIQIWREDKELLIITKTGSNWHMSQPVQHPASMFRINSLLGFLQSKVITRFKVEPSRLGEYGLAPARTWLALDDMQFYFGDINPLDRGRFIYYEDTVYVVEDKLFQQLLQPREFFFSKRMLDLSDDLQRIQCGPLVLEKINGQWQQSGGAKKMSMNEIRITSNAWKNLEAESISLSSNTNNIGEVLLMFAKVSETVILVRSREPELILSPQGSGYDYRLPAAMAQTLAIPQAGC